MNKPPILCDKCDSNFSCLLDYDGENCRKTRSVELTHADHIRAMTNEELAELIGDTIDCGFCKDMANRDVCPVSTDNERDCHKYWLDWLKQEVKDG